MVNFENFAMGYDRVLQKLKKKSPILNLNLISTKFLVLLTKFLGAGIVELNFLFVFHRVLTGNFFWTGSVLSNRRYANSAFLDV